MSLSNSFDFTLNRNALITKALRMIGAISAEQEPTTSEISHGSESLNLMIKAWQADGMQIWAVTQLSVTPIIGKYKYTFGLNGDISVSGLPQEIYEIHRRETSTVVDVPLNRLARVDYWQLSDKDTQGTPVNYYFDQKVTNNQASLYIWPAPDSNFNTNYTLEVLYQKPFDDMDSATDTLAFPQPWELAIVYGLAHLLAVEYGLPNADRNALKKDAYEEKLRVMDWDTEHASIFLTPDFNAFRP